MSAAPLLEITTLISGLRPDQILLEQTEVTILDAQPEQGQYAYGSLKAGQLCATESNQNKMLTFQTSGVPIVTQSQPDPEQLTTLADADRLAGFPLKQPTKLPQGMPFTYAQVKQDSGATLVTLNYSDGNQVISVSQVKGSPETLESLSKDHPEAYQPVTIHGQLAILSQGFFNENGWKGIPNGGDGGASVTWFENGIQYSVGGFNAYASNVWLEIAESLK